jgi:predicted nucleotidyltransferase
LILLSQIIIEQRKEVENYRNLASEFVKKEVSIIPGLIGVLLTGSTARGDARLSPHGFSIDILIVMENNCELNLLDKFNESILPEFPFHVIKRNNTYINIESKTIGELSKIREMREDVIFAKNESMILMDSKGILEDWKKSSFHITNEDIRSRALDHKIRFEYLINNYRQEKWDYRDAKTQIAQNYNEANECYCAFLHCINGSFVPRRDWLVYLTYEYEIKPDNHAQLLENVYATGNKTSLATRWQSLIEIKKWIDQYCQNKNWY